MFVSTMKITLGHKQVPRVWFAKFHSAILQAGSVKSKYDHTLRIEKTASLSCLSMWMTFSYQKMALTALDN